MKPFLAILGVIVVSVLVQMCCRASDARDPYSVGGHWDYTIRCEDGFLWKQLDHGTIPVLHTDGKHVRCGEKRH